VRSPVYEVPEVPRPAMGGVVGAAALGAAGAAGATFEEGTSRGVEETIATVVVGRAEVGKTEEDAATDVGKTGEVLAGGALVGDATATGVLVAITALSVEVDGADTSITLDVGSTSAAPAVTQMVLTTFSVCVTMSQSVT